MCNKHKNKKCGCDEPKICGCKTKVPLECTVYNSNVLEAIGAIPGMSGEEVIKLLIKYVENSIEEIETDPVSLESVGGGIEVYRGLSNFLDHEFRTLKQGPGVKLTLNPNTTEITVGLDMDWIGNYVCGKIEECGGGVPHQITTTDIVRDVVGPGWGYEFTPDDFLDNFSDNDPSHTLSEIQIIGNVEGISQDGFPYVEGTWVSIDNIYSLAYEAPIDHPGGQIQFTWRAKDNVGNISTN